MNVSRSKCFYISSKEIFSILFFFICNRILKKVVKSFAEDTRCEVHRTVLAIREGKTGWLDIFFLGGIACGDDGEIVSSMVKKSF